LQIASKGEGGKQPIASAHNCDHNEATVDGKRITHAMTSIFMAHKHGRYTLPRIPKARNFVFNVNYVPGDSLSAVFSMINPIIVLCPSLAEASLVEYDDLHRAVLRELVYGLCRSNVFIQNTNIPQWMVFHSALCDTELTTTGVAFNPIIMATPTNYSTVYTTMLRVQEVGKELGFEHLPLFFYMGLLTKALEIQWANPDSLSGVALGDGGMHLIMSLFSGIGCLYEDAGLKNILIDSNVFAAGTVQQIMKGKDFDRALESYKMLKNSCSSVFSSSSMCGVKKNLLMLAISRQNWKALI